MQNLYLSGRLVAMCAVGLLFFFIYPSNVSSFTNLSNNGADENIAAELVPITPILECVEDLGNGVYRATFGYDNPNETDVKVPPGNSRVVWNETLRQEKVLNDFQPGTHESVLQVVFDTKTVEDGLTWIIRIPKKASMEASADADSEQCQPIIGAIQNFRATPVSISQIDLSWDEPAATEAFTYTIERSETGSDPWTEVVSGLAQNITTFSDIGLDEFTEYTYRITAGNNDFTTGFATTLARTNSVLSSVTNLNGKNGDKIGFELTSLAIGASGGNPSPRVYQFDDDGDVLVEVVAFKNPSTTAAVVNLLQTKYGRTSDKFILDPNTYINLNRNLIDIYFDTTRLEELNFEEIINFVRPVFKPFTSAIGETGAFHQPDSTQGSLDVRSSFKVNSTDSISGITEQVFLNGAGQKIGVLSNSFNTQPGNPYLTDQLNEDLPGPSNPNFPLPVEVLLESPFLDTDEGRAMLQIAHDVAPGAQLGFHNGTLSLNTFWQGITALSDAGYNILVDDITFLVESFFRQEGPPFDAIQDHLDSGPGKMYVSSSGNFSELAIEGTLNFVPLPANSDIYPDSVNGYIHDFGGGDLTKDIFANTGEYVIVFQWDQAFASLGDEVGAMDDLDMFVVNDSLLVEAGNNRVNFDGDAAEILVLRATEGKASNIVFTCECDTPPVGLSYRMVVFDAQGEGDGLVFTEPISGPTTTGHASFSFPNLITTGASFYGYYGDTSLGPEMEPFSSLGAPGVVDYTAPDGGNTNVLSIGSDIEFDADVFPNFFGTSAAAPAAAALNALMLQAIPAWYPSGIPVGIFTDPGYATGNPSDEATGLLKQTATPLSNPDLSGAGVLRGKEAFSLIATPTPILLGFSADSTKVISVDTVQVSLFGENFDENSLVIFNGDTIPATFISETELQVIIGPFSGDGGFVVASAPSSTPAGGDGGPSNQLDLLDGRRALTIVAKDTTFTFGQDFDALEFEVLGLLEGETYESLGLPDVALNSTAMGPYPFVGNYVITPSFAAPLTAEQENQFVVGFQRGVLSITSLPLTIQVADTTAVYGEEPVVAINYIYDSSGITDNAAFLDFLKSEHESTFLTDTSSTGVLNRFSAVVNRFSAVVNENPGRIGEIIDLLTNSNWIATETTIQNRFSPVVNRFSAVVNIVPLDADQLLDFLDNPLVGNSGAIENRFSAVVNGEDLVTGLTSVFDPLENRFSPVVNRFSAVVNRFSAVVNVPLGNEDDETDLIQTLALVDAEDGNNTEFDTVAVYSINLITGLDVTFTNADRHYMVSGAALSPIFTNCIVNYQPGRLTVTPAPITITLDEIAEKTYGEPVEFSSTITGNTAFGDTLIIDYFLNPVPASDTPISVGNYTVEQAASTTDSTGVDNSDNYDFTIINGPLVVNPATLTIDTEDVVITEDQDIPPASEINSTITGYISGEGPTDVFGPAGPVFSYSSPEYEMMGRIPGTYVLLTSVSPEPVNYDVVSNPAQLLVNLADGRKIRIYLDCVDENRGQGVEYPATAYFSYENDNDVSVFIAPMSPNNLLIGTSFDPSGLPFEFLPGHHQVTVPFGGNLRWEVTSFGSTNPSSQEVDSDDLRGKRCKGGDIINGRIADPDANATNDAFDSGQIQYYPNPVNDHLVIRVSEDFNHNDYELYDSQGIRHSVNALIDASAATAEFDFSRFETGLYLLKLNINGSTAIIRVLRQ